jgi:hypothetical protein
LSASCFSAIKDWKPSGTFSITNLPDSSVIPFIVLLFSKNTVITERLLPRENLNSEAVLLWFKEPSFI